MKQPEYNEIDSLLRTWAGRSRSVSGRATGNRADAHLDADELSSYAENALPPATRARYTAHIVDCDDCRKVVAQLAVAAGPVLKETPVDLKPEIAGWRKALTAFFSPAVIKFAVPALAAVIVGVVFFASRPTSRMTLENKGTQPAMTDARSPAQEGAKPAPAVPSQTSTTAEKVDANTDIPVARPTPSGSQHGGEKEQAQAGATVNDSYAALAKKPEEPRKETAAVASEADEEQSKRRAATQPAATAPAPPAKPASNAPPKDAPSDAIGGRALNDKDKNERKREAANATAGGADVAAPMSVASSDDRQKTKAIETRSSVARRDEAGETRTVAGRRFERRGNIWVDTAYKSSMSAVNVSRGSEQYRALIADEPEIDAIANQLKGDVFLVWKGRAYHLR
jgi:hypothetical protein